MKQLLFFNDSMTMGGTEKLLVNLLNHLSEKDCKITLLLPQPSDNDILIEGLSPKVTLKYIYKKAPSHFHKKMGENIMIFFPKLFGWWKSLGLKKYDEVVCFKETFFAPIFSHLKAKKLLWIHNILYKRDYNPQNTREKLSISLNKKQLKKVQKSYDKFNTVICVSEAAKNAYLDVLHDNRTPKQDIRIIHNAIDTSQIIVKAKEAVESISKSKINFMLITRVSPEKRIDRLISAVNRLIAEGYDFHVYIVGEGIENLVKNENSNNATLKNTITFLGQLDNPYPYIAQCNWSLCVSERESFSLSLLESMALGVPVITTDCGGPRDIVNNGEYGLLVHNSTEGVYFGMKSVLDDSEAKEKYSINLDRAVTRFDYNGWLTKIENLLSI